MVDIGGAAALIEEHLSLADGIAGRFARRYSDLLSFDDLQSLARIGLSEAAQRYDATTGVPFSAYARARVEGAVMDGIRRALANASPLVDEAVSSSLTPAELLKGGFSDAWSHSTASAIERANVIVTLERAQSQLPAEQRRLLELRYELELTFADIALQLGWTAARVRQEHALALDALRQLVAR